MLKVAAQCTGRLRRVVPRPEQAHLGKSRDSGARHATETQGNRC
ncbi:hypothetical protein ACU4GI_06765 [Cupriavidus basilensis]